MIDEIASLPILAESLSPEVGRILHGKLWICVDHHLEIRDSSPEQKISHPM
jgi:hypothetical protein